MKYIKNVTYTLLHKLSKWSSIKVIAVKLKVTVGESKEWAISKYIKIVTYTLFHKWSDGGQVKKVTARERGE